MKCAWKSADEKKRLSEICENYGLLFLAYIESLTENAAADVFGVGRRKLSQMRAETDAEINRCMSLYAETDTDGSITGELWETTQDTEFGLSKKLRDIGVDIGAINREIPVPDEFGRSWHTAAEFERYAWRRHYIDDMDVKANVCWAVILLWWHAQGYGAARLNKYYREIRRRYVPFPSLFLHQRSGWREKMEKMVSAEQARLEARGVEFEAVRTKAMQSGVLPVSDRWLEKLRNIAKS